MDKGPETCVSNGGRWHPDECDCHRYLESVAIASAFARSNGYEINTTQELVAIGCSNIVSFFVGSFPVTGSFSRTAVNSATGVATPAAGLITGTIVLVCIQFLTPLMRYVSRRCGRRGSGQPRQQSLDGCCVSKGESWGLTRAFSQVHLESLARCNHHRVGTQDVQLETATATMESVEDRSHPVGALVLRVHLFRD